MRLLPFSLYTLAGSYLWCLALAWAGMKLGEHWNRVGPDLHRFDGVVAALCAAAVAVALYRRLRAER